MNTPQHVEPRGQVRAQIQMGSSQQSLVHAAGAAHFARCLDVAMRSVDRGLGASRGTAKPVGCGLVLVRMWFDFLGRAKSSQAGVVLSRHPSVEHIFTEDSFGLRRLFMLLEP